MKEESDEARRMNVQGLSLQFASISYDRAAKQLNMLVHHVC